MNANVLGTVLLQAVVAESRHPSRYQPPWRTLPSPGRGRPQSPNRSLLTLIRTITAPTRVTKDLRFRGPRPELVLLPGLLPIRAGLPPGRRLLSIPHLLLPLARLRQDPGRPSPVSLRRQILPVLRTMDRVLSVPRPVADPSLSVDRVRPVLHLSGDRREVEIRILLLLDNLLVDTSLECLQDHLSAMDRCLAHFLGMG